MCEWVERAERDDEGDLTDQLREGASCLGIILGKGYNRQNDTGVGNKVLNRDSEGCTCVGV